MKRLLLLFLLTLVFLPQSAHAQLDARCWTQDDCLNRRETDDIFDTMSDEELLDGFVQLGITYSACGGQKNAAGEDIGFCLPVGQTETKIAFGGKRQFLHIGEFIQVIYEYAIIIAGILSVIVLIFAGITWTTSGGNAERIGAAKKRIGGALMGLLLAVLSYSLLNTLNPNLVNIRLPQVWLINSQDLAPTLCSDIQKVEGTTSTYPGLIQLAPTKTKLEEKQTKLTQLLKSEPAYTVKKENATCGYDFVVDGTGGQTCAGTVCAGKNQLCAPAETTLGYDCIAAKIAGKIVNTSLKKTALPDFVTEEWGDDLVDIGETELWAICNHDTYEEVSGVRVNHTRKANQIDFTLAVSDDSINRAVQACSNNVEGFTLVLEMDEANDFTDEDHMVGIKGRNAVDLGDWGAVDEIINYIVTNDKSSEYFISLPKLKGGIPSLTIDIVNIVDIDDGDSQREKAYAEFDWGN